jgi:HEAT repeat protein
MAEKERSLIELLDSVQEQDRRQALERVPTEGDLLCAAVCRRIGREDPSDPIRVLATQVLKRLANKVGELPPDPRAILTEPDPRIRGGWIVDIALAQEVGYLPSLAERALSETDPNVRAALALAVGILGSSEHRELLEMLMGDKVAEVRLRALDGLDALGDPDRHPSFVRALRDPEAPVRNRAMKTLRKLRPDQLLDVCRAMTAAPDTWRRESASHLLGTSGMPDAVPLLVPLLEDKIESVREMSLKAVRALADQGVERAKEALAKAPKSKADAWAESVFEEIDGAGKPARQTGPLFDGDPKVRLKAIESIVKAKSLKEIPLLEERVAGESEPAVLIRILLAFGQLQSKGSIPHLQDALAHATSDVRRAAIEGLRLINEHASLDRIVPLLADSDLSVRTWAIVALSVRENVDTVTPLSALLGSAQDTEILRGLEAVEQIKTKKVIELVAPLRAHASAKVREAVKATLTRLAEKKNPTATILLKETGDLPASLAAPVAKPVGALPGRTYSSAGAREGGVSRPAAELTRTQPSRPEPPKPPTPEPPPPGKNDPPPASASPDAPPIPVVPPRVEAALLGLFGMLEIGREAPTLIGGAGPRPGAVAALLGLVVASWALAQTRQALSAAPDEARNRSSTQSGFLALVGLGILLVELAFIQPNALWLLTAVSLLPLLPFLFGPRGR